MDTTWFNQHLQEQAPLIVFVNVWLQQMGLPLPSVPTLVMAGSRISAAGFPLLLGLAVAASLLADWVWYLAGRAFGYRVLSLLCRLSVNPGSCVSQAETRFVRWGAWSLLFAKFIPGFSTVAPPIAGALNMPLGRFMLASAGGAGLWAGLALGAGMLFEGQISLALEMLSLYGVRALTVLGFGLVVLLLWKLIQKYRFDHAARMPHATPEELDALIQAGIPVRLLDLRSPRLIAETGALPGAVVADYEAADLEVADLPKEHAIVTLCACPQDAAAVFAARGLQQMGYVNARPLAGGYDAWHGYLQARGRLEAGPAPAA